MSTGRLKPQYNRVRASDALKVTGIWANTIGVEQEMGANTAIEDSLHAPGGKGGSRRSEKQQRAQELVAASGFKAAVTDYEGLKALAKAATGGGNATRGACKVCGGLGHLTKQCRNRAAAAAAAEGNEESIAARSAMALLTEADDDEGLNELLGSSSSDSGSGSDSDDERRGRKRKRREDDSKRRKKSKKDKKDKKAKHKRSKSKERRSKKEKRSRRSRSRSRSRSPGDSR